MGILIKTDDKIEWRQCFLLIKLLIVSRYKHTRFFISNTYKQCQAELAKIQVNAKQHTEAKLLQFEGYLHSSLVLLSKSNRIYSKKQDKERLCLC